MKRGSLSTYFAGVGVKSLSATEIDPTVSRGHELQGVDAIQAFLGVPVDKRRIQARYFWLSDDEDPLTFEGDVTWYDSRKGKVDRVPEPRLYYPKASEPIVYRAKPGDTLFVCLGRDETITFLFCGVGTTIEKQLLWLFGLQVGGGDIVEKDFRGGADVELGLSARYILGLIGIDARIEDDDWLARLTRKFGNKFPTTAVFSAFARTTAAGVDVIGDPDGTLLRWLEMEELLFYTLERHIVDQRLRAGFLVEGEADVDGFVSFSLSVQNRRKSRAGHSLEHHLASVFEAHKLDFDRGGRTEGNKRPDFLFPGTGAYLDPTFPVNALTLLGAKSSCKDRWRQVLSEGERVPQKHLVTLEPGISVNQTDEMQAAGLQLIVPGPLHSSYRPEQLSWLMSLADLLAMTKARAA
ncbi:type II restriction endonuclease [uncultured Brevundimonas sp.]|uniref:type II restriction endonuclease n=1 Tax=uncultured Brevundimonas sp. TaxID=213418 RepID=UPI0030ECA1F8|tara:strand:+ start:97295 stop:98521 length:1227 start_codon:yes stop_codon:yes gene_type:complete